MTDPAFDIQGLHKSYLVGTETVPVLRDIDLVFDTGEFVSIMGPSGSGKSTLLQILGCLDKATSGQVRVQGQDIAAISDDDLSLFRCHALGFIFQRFHLLPSYDAISNVSMAMVYAGRVDRRERAEQLLTDLGLGHRLYHRPNALSGGEQQRVAIARAMANDPAIILADEPTGALDQANGKAILDILDEFHREGRTIILVTHDMEVAQRAERLIELVDGRIHHDQRLR